jgi:hypothetical protein
MKEALPFQPGVLKVRLVGQRCLPVVLGILLLSASLLRVWPQVRHPQPLNGSFLNHPAIAGSIAVFEAAFGLVLIARLWPRWAWHSVIVVFGLFAIITAADAVQGKDSCGCFGAFHVKPIYTMCLDLAAVGALILTGKPEDGGSGVGGSGFDMLTTRPSSSRSAGGSGRRRWIVAGGLATAWVAAVAGM